ncbi:MAG TPA: hypothetical protein PK125_01400 [Syntrophorhabdus sp.]|jgi:uncharacterized membrane protein YjfL (UPF0719 family)|nr:hypothetical protein [Syntrophorhabdus sp.]MDI9557220.1 hypothetical protein [Pseudomonadota bacterium]OPX98348.1 MAG: hypothetical protein A4E59_00483 [Syntrophorhabdus sp. PtaB.Bin027]OQB76873.1 MAG: hypothetical protein BWX92_01422 [Deltaproteobacteria bacterium ADurb.Bin135]MBP8743533.1 hypothetical protein [Syntrophorhabdus sp.]
MWRVLSNIIEMFVYSAVYIIIVLIMLKVFGATFTSEFEKKISEDGNMALSILCAGLLIGLSLLLASIIR